MQTHVLQKRNLLKQWLMDANSNSVVIKGHIHYFMVTYNERKIPVYLGVSSSKVMNIHEIFSTGNQESVNTKVNAI